MLFRYTPLRASGPIVSLGGRTYRSRPLVPVTIVGPRGSAVETALLDPGADDTVMPDRAAARAGIDLTKAPIRSASGVGAPPSFLRYVQVHLRLTDGKEFREWLGIAGCLQFFDADFRGELEEVELRINGLYPGT
jgi:hypothetical protein